MTLTSAPVVIAGGHGKIALRLERLLADRGASPVGIVRNSDHVGDLSDAGASAVLYDLESGTVDGLAEQLAGAQAVVFAAGAGAGGAPGRTEAVDRDGAILLADAAAQAGVRRYLLVSSIGAGAEPPADLEPAMARYLRAKTAAEQAVAERDLDLTVLRPVSLSDDPGTGRVRLAEHVDRGSISRQDVAAVLAELLDAPDTAGRTLELVAGDDPIAEAVAAC